MFVTMIALLLAVSMTNTQVMAQGEDDEPQDIEHTVHTLPKAPGDEKWVEDLDLDNLDDDETERAKQEAREITDADIDTTQGVKIIKRGKFYTTLEEFDNVLVLFVDKDDSKCGQCVTVKESLNKALNETSVIGLTTYVAMVECSEHQSVCEKHGIKMYPSLKLFAGGLAIYEYTDITYTISDIEKFVVKYTKEKTTEITTKQQFEDFTTNNKVTVVFFRDDLDEADQLANRPLGSFRRTAAALVDKFAFGEVILNDETNEIAEQYESQAQDIAMFRAIGGVQHIAYEGTVTRKRLHSWVLDNAPWVVHEVKEDTSIYELLEDGKWIPILTLYIPYTNEQAKDAAIIELQKIVRLFKRQVLFTYSDSARAGATLSRRGLSADEPHILINSVLGRLTYVYDGEIEEEALQAWVESVVQNRAEPHYIKQEAPEEQTEVVQTVVYDTYRDFIFNNTRDAVIFFRLPDDHCPPCKMLFPIYEKVATALKDEPYIVFGSYDMYLNDKAPGNVVYNFPAIQFFRIDDKYHDETYSGTRTFDDLINWVEEQSSFELAYFDKEYKGKLDDVEVE